MTASRLSEPDVLAKQQWDGLWHRSAALSSEKRLMLAVLKNALECYRKYAFSEDRQSVQMFEEADVWIRCDSDAWLFSFTNVCETLGVCSESLRRDLTNWHQLAEQERIKA